MGAHFVGEVSAWSSFSTLKRHMDRTTDETQMEWKEPVDLEGSKKYLKNHILDATLPETNIAHENHHLP